MQEAIKNELFREIASSLIYKRPKTNRQKANVMTAGNKLFDKTSRFYYPKTIAAKTGYHADSRYVLVAAAEDCGRVLIGCVAGCQQNQDRYESMIKMFETAFQEKQVTRSFFGMNHLFSKKVEGGKQKLEAFLKEDLSISYYPSQAPQFRAFVLWKIPDFPIQKGAVIGEVQMIDASGRVLKRGELFAKNEVEGLLFYRWKKRLENLF
ncbi:MAG: hypothetical protein HY324_01535 [Chlamydiia bacterium]|nr:hypothetical protein [Chlamydiia bacterium]